MVNKKFIYEADQNMPVSMIATEYPLEYDPDGENGNIPSISKYEEIRSQLEE